MSCASPETRLITPDIPPDLRQPVPVPQRTVTGLRDVAILYTDTRQALDLANGRIIATDCILRAAERGAQPDCFPTLKEGGQDGP